LHQPQFKTSQYSFFVFKNSNTTDMSLIASAIGAGVGLLGSLWGGSKAGQERKKMNNYLNQQDAENTSWYNANALSDYTQRQDSQNLLRQLREQLDKQNRAQANTAVITGATPEQQAVQKELSNEVISDTYSNLGAQGQAYKDRISDRYMQMRSNIANQRMGMMERQAQSYENVMSGGLNMLSNSGSGLLNSLTS
jgi:hypothetical protein